MSPAVSVPMRNQSAVVPKLPRIVNWYTLPLVGVNPVLASFAPATSLFGSISFGSPGGPSNPIPPGPLFQSESSNARSRQPAPSVPSDGTWYDTPRPGVARFVTA